VSHSVNSLQGLFPGESAMSALMRAHEWEKTPLGDPRDWPDGLKVPLRMMLTSRFEMWLGWGEDLAFFYNDAYVPTLGAKHPDALGRPMREVWREVYDAVADRIDSVMNRGVATWDKALLLLLERNGYPEETYHTFSYSPLRGDTGAIEGLMCVVTEETERIISERRLDILRRLATALIPVRARAGVKMAAEAALDANARDFTFAHLIYLEGAEAAERRDGAGNGPAPPGPAAVDWPFADLIAGGKPMQVALEGLVTDPPKGAWDVPPTEALLVPVTNTRQSAPVAALVLGLNPHRRTDAEIVGFAELVANQIAGALAIVDAQVRDAAEMERLRGPEHRFELVNSRYIQVVGHRDVVGRTVWEALPEVRQQGFLELLDDVYRTSRPYVGQSVPISLQRTPGAPPEMRMLDFVYQPMREPDGTISGIFVEGIDVTSAHDAVAALRESEGRFRTLAEAMPNQVWMAQTDGGLDWVNQQVLDYSGRSADHLLGTGWADLVHPHDIELAASRWAASLATGRTYETEFRLVDGSGTYRWHIARAVPLCAEDGTVLRWIGTNTDIDGQKAAAEALMQLTQTLEQQVSERTTRLMEAEEALRQSQKMEAVGQLTGGIAHDFNNLLAGIGGNLELLERRIAQNRLEALPRYVGSAQSAVKRAAALTQRLLAFSRRQTLDPRPVNVNRLVADMEELIRRTVGPSVEIEVVGAAGLWPTLIDPNQLENALLNLCINARDAMPDGGKLTVETANKWLDDHAARERDLPPGQYVSLCVTDTGCGMTPEVAARAFDPFFTTKPIGEGTGLGLSMIYGFIRQSGGQVRIYSEPDQGTTMCLYLPRYFGELQQGVATSAAPPANYDGHGEVVLVIDDDPTVRTLIIEVLGELGYTARVAEDGPSGLKVLQSAERIDLLVTDVGLPGGLNGRQVADAGRAVRPDLKVIFITGYAENAVVRNGILDPGMKILTKPFSIEAFTKTIGEALESVD
jgi:PAS domain S-box-containing protein